MARKRYSDEDVLNLPRQIELSLASGSSVETACRSASGCHPSASEARVVRAAGLRNNPHGRGRWASSMSCDSTMAFQSHFLE